jgi:hypothetical protein
MESSRARSFGGHCEAAIMKRLRERRLSANLPCGRSGRSVQVKFGVPKLVR